MEERWVAKRSQLRQLLLNQPDWTNQMYADYLGMSLAWVKDWKRVFRCADPDDETVVWGRSRHRRTPFDVYDDDIIQAVLDIRDNPPDYCPRVPGPALIQYELHRRFADSGRRYPHSTSTIWRILDQHQRILRLPEYAHEPFERPEPMRHWEIDFTDITTIPGDPDGKHKHAVEMLNMVDRGTSILVESAARDDFTAETSIRALTGAFIIHGLPDFLTIDRDPRFIGGWQGDDFPSVFMRFIMCLNITLDICPPRRPDLKPFVERVHRTIQEECLYRERPATLPEARDLLRDFVLRYNSERPHQGSACGNRPPYDAFPRLPRLRPLPHMIDPDSWLNAIDRRSFRRRVRANGSVTVDNRSYYVGRQLRGQQVVLRVDASAREFQVIHQRNLIKTMPIKGLYNEPMEFADYLDFISEEAQTEWRKTKRLVRQRRLLWAA